MSTAGIASIALFAPVVASNAIFSARRASRGVDSIEENPLFAIANFDIAAGQILKGGRAAKALAVAIDPASDITNNGSKEIIKNSAKTTAKASTKTISIGSKVLEGAKGVVKFTADHINPIIIGAGVLKVAGSDDKLDTAARESTSLLCMFGAEGLTKEFIGMPYSEKVNGKTVSVDREGLYKKLFSEKQLKAMQEYCATKKGVKIAANSAKGLLFVGASIAGYQAGNKIAEIILGKKEKQEN